MGDNLREKFYLREDVSYLNHGSFGACPRDVMAAYQHWQIELERNPIDYFVRQLRGLFTHDSGGPLEEVRERLAQFVGADPQGLIFTPNVTVALNAIASALPLDAGVEVLTTDHEYGTIEAAWARKCKESSATLIKVPIDLPVGDPEAFIEHFWSRVTSRTRVILMSHISSATALVLPVQEICKRAREAGIVTVIDGAHAVGQLALDLVEIGADFYTSNCHKWLLTPKGTAFLYVHPDMRESFRPLIISWAEINQPSFSLRHEMWGTRDMAAFLAIPAALDFRETHGWDAYMAQAREMVRKYRICFNEALEQEQICGEQWLAQMASVLLPSTLDGIQLWKALWEKHQIEAMITSWRSRPLLRLGFNAYNTEEELKHLLSAVVDLTREQT